ncbi:MAG: ABC transporter permease [Lachnospiraceae bacterium]|jgi:ABC-2 type transport system permease protein|nr:ABC transporter permease [Lachnospiraceae bacterium]
MGKLLKSEAIKLLTPWGYKIFLLCSLGIGLLLGVTGVALGGLSGTPMTGYDVLMEFITEPQIVGVMAGIFTSFFIGNEFSHRTFGNAIINGCSRTQIFLAKVIVFMLGLSVILILLPLVATIYVTAIQGFGPINTDILLHILRTIVLTLLGYVTFGSLCVLFAMLIKKPGAISGILIAIFLCLTMFIQLMGASENIIIGQIVRSLFVYQFMLSTHPESVLTYVVVCVVTSIICLTAGLYTFKNTELK